MNYTSNPIHSIFTEQLQILKSQNEKKTWAEAIKAQLSNLGFNYIFTMYNDEINYLPQLYQSLRDQFIQKWNVDVKNQPKLFYYRMFKKEFEYEKYLDVDVNAFARRQLSRLRLSSH